MPKLINEYDIMDMDALQIEQPTGIDAILAERGSRYGSFREHAIIAQSLKEVMWDTAGWGRMWADQKQALEVIADKIARALNGDPNYLDNWTDIIGYAKLVEDRLREDEKGGAR